MDFQRLTLETPHVELDGSITPSITVRSSTFRFVSSTDYLDRFSLFLDHRIHQPKMPLKLLPMLDLQLLSTNFDTFRASCD